MHDALRNWGLALAEQARRKTGEEADRLFALAAAKDVAALAIKPDMHDALCDWGLALHERAKLKTGEEADRLFALAGSKYEEALAIKPDVYDALYNWGATLMAQGRLLAGAERETALRKAGDVLLRAARIEPDKVYNLACLAALQGKPEECRELLLRCLRAGTLPAVSHLSADADLVGVRDLRWFQELLREASERQPPN
jgi:tetratricopeptide (TPR) repeat protein